MIDYEIRIYESISNLRHVCTDYLRIAITRQVNGVGTAAFEVNAASIAAQYCVQGNYLAIYRSDVVMGIQPSLEFSGVIRRVDRIEDEREYLQVAALDMIHLLGTRIVAYKAGISNKSTWRNRPTETILRQLFTQNLGASATTANGRIKSGVISGMSTGGTSGTGTVQSIACAYQNVLSVMQKLAEAGGGDFDLIWTVGQINWDFNWYVGQRGTNRTSTVVLSVDNGTLASARIIDDRIEDFTSVIIGGGGENLARRVTTRPSPLPTGVADREFFMDARNQAKATVAQLQAMATRRLASQARLRTRYEVAILQNGSYLYGRDYFFGDRISLDVLGTRYTVKVRAVNLEFGSDGKEKVGIELIGA